MTTYKDLNTILNWPDLFAPSHHFFLIRDTLTADGTFLLPHFLNSYLLNVNNHNSKNQNNEQQKHHVRFINLNHSYFHYSTIELKLNMNLQKESSSQKNDGHSPSPSPSFLFVDAQNGLLQSTFSSLPNQQFDDDDTNDLVHPLSYTSPIHVRSKFYTSSNVLENVENSEKHVREMLKSQVPTGFVQWNYRRTKHEKHEKNEKNDETVLDSLFKMITSDHTLPSNHQSTNASVDDKGDKGAEKQQVLLGSNCQCIILDHVDVLALYTAKGFNDVFMFIQRLLSWAQSNSTSIVMLMHGDGEAKLMANLLEQSANVVFRVRGLPTGYSKDVHGLVEVIYEKVTGNEHTDANAMRLLSRQTLHYKCFEHNVTLFSPGSHSDII